MTRIKSSGETFTLCWTLIIKPLPTFICATLVHSVDGMNASGQNETLRRKHEVYRRKQTKTHLIRYKNICPLSKSIKPYKVFYTYTLSVLLIGFNNQDKHSFPLTGLKIRRNTFSCEFYNHLCLDLLCPDLP